MPQEFMILKCFSCSMHQVHQIRKSKVWVCKVCREKQSQQKIYGQGSGKECRVLVQQLNMKKRNLEEQFSPVHNTDGKSCDELLDRDDSGISGPSKWLAFKPSSNISDEKIFCDVDDQSFEGQMTRYDIKTVLTSTTLDAEEWTGCRKRRLMGRRARQRREDSTIVAKDLRNTTINKENHGVVDKSMQATSNSFKSQTKGIKRNNIFDPTKSRSPQIHEMPPNKSSKWCKFETDGDASEDDDKNDVIFSPTREA